ncbi:chaperone NapD [Ruegeria arenilitoris]|uniref:chaperone NapD n=1 Tax=Ruegeria arenilitoris TaxID=1173585 RepID=UPI00147CFA90|nr:chaperone NapD [Ruegeria arenilitoris]MBY6082184.1 chaperone NapD [Ruegeria arenilitoris]
MNICGCLVHVAPDQTSAARSAMTAFDGVEVHAESDDSRFVVVVEDTPTRLASEIIMDLHQIPGVVSLTLTYHHFEDLAETRPRPETPSQDSSRRPLS